MLLLLPRFKVSFYKLPVVRGYIEAFDRSLGKRGVKETFRLLAERMKIAVDVHMSDKTWNTLENEGVILLCNHPSSFFDPLPISQAIPDRKDLKVIGSDNVLLIGPHTSELIIPVYIREKHRVESKNFLSKPGLYMANRDEVSDEQKKKLNRRSIDQSREHIESGGSLLLFPEGTRHGGQWFPGVGYILSGVENLDVKIVFANLQKVSSFDALRWISRPRKEKIIPVHFSDPIPVGEILGVTREAKPMRDHLQERYQFWVSSITKTK